MKFLVTIVLLLIFGTAFAAWFEENDLNTAQADYNCALRMNCADCLGEADCSWGMAVGETVYKCNSTAETNWDQEYVAPVSNCPTKCGIVAPAIVIHSLLYNSVSSNNMNIQFTLTRASVDAVYAAFQSDINCVSLVRFIANLITLGGEFDAVDIDGVDELAASPATVTTDVTTQAAKDAFSPGASNPTITTDVVAYGRYTYTPSVNSNGKTTTAYTPTTALPAPKEESSGDGDGTNIGLIAGIAGGGVGAVILGVFLLVLFAVVIVVVVVIIIIIIVVIVIVVVVLGGGSLGGGALVVKKKRSQSLLPVASMNMSELSAPHVELTDL